eukprot:gene24105-29254_t
MSSSPPEDKASEGDEFGSSPTKQNRSEEVWTKELPTYAVDYIAQLRQKPTYMKSFSHSQLAKVFLEKRSLELDARVMQSFTQALQSELKELKLSMFANPNNLQKDTKEVDDFLADLTKWIGTNSVKVEVNELLKQQQDVRITGDPAMGEMLVAVAPNHTGKFVFRWQRIMQDGLLVPIKGAKAPQYVVTRPDVGKRVMVAAAKILPDGKREQPICGISEVEVDAPVKQDKFKSSKLAVKTEAKEDKMMDELKA